MKSRAFSRIARHTSVTVSTPRIGLGLVKHHAQNKQNRKNLSSQGTFLFQDLFSSEKGSPIGIVCPEMNFDPKYLLVLFVEMTEYMCLRHLQSY